MRREACPVLCILLLASGCARLPAGAEPTGPEAASELGQAVLEGCGPVELPPLRAEFHEFTPIEERMSDRPFLPILATSTLVSSLDDVTGFAPLTPGAAPGDLPLQAIALSGAGTDVDANVTLLYAPTPVGREEVLPDFLRRDGIAVIQRPAGDERGTAADVVAEVGGRAVVVPVGKHDAVLVHGEPVGDDRTRPYGLHWSDGIRDWSVSGIAAPEDLISFGRSLYCP